MWTENLPSRECETLIEVLKHENLPLKILFLEINSRKKS